MDRMIYFLHIHKSGGSTFVNLAIKNKEKLHGPNKNGNPYDKSGKIIPFWDYDHSKLMEFFEKGNFTFCANETCLKQMHIDPKIKYVAVVRHPIDILISCYHHEKFGTKSNKTFEKFLEDRMLLERNKLSLQKYENLYFKHPLIYYFSGGSNPDLAKERIKKFDAIIFLDNYAQDVKVMEKVAGWKILDVNKHRIGTNRNSNHKKELSPKSFEILNEKMKKDIDFYNEIKLKVKDGVFID